jgi:hypothetical protein
MKSSNPGLMVFTYQFEEGSPVTEISLSSQSCLSEVFESFENFLRGSGYFFDGRIDTVQDEPARVDDEYLTN